MKTEKDLTQAQLVAYRKTLAALDSGNYGLAVSLAAPIVAEVWDFFPARLALRKAQIARSKPKSSFLGGLSFGRSKTKKLVEDGEFIAAMAEAEKALDADPTGVQPNRDLFDAAEAGAVVERSTLLHRQSEFDAATEHSKPDAARALDAAAKKTRDFETIARFALETIALDPKNKQARHDLGDYLLHIEEYKDAVDFFEEMVRKDPKDLDARDKGKKAAALRSMKGRGKSFEEDIERRKKESQETGQKVVGAEESADDLALKVYQAHEAGNPDRESARKLAAIYFNREDYTKALEYYRYLSALANDTDPGLLRKISDTELLLLSRDIADKEKQLDTLAADSAEAANLGAEIAELKRRKAEQLLDETRRRVERNPTDLQARFEYGEQLVVARYYKEAIPELQKARSNPNTRTKALNLLGKCYTERNMLDLAAKTLTDAASEIPGMDATKKDILYNLGLVYGRMGNAPKALECFKQIYEVDYEYRDVARRVEDSYTTPPPDPEDGSPGAGVPASLSPTTPPLEGSAAKKLPPDEEENA